VRDKFRRAGESRHFINRKGAESAENLMNNKDAKDAKDKFQTLTYPVNP